MRTAREHPGVHACPRAGYDSTSVPACSRLFRGREPRSAISVRGLRRGRPTRPRTGGTRSSSSSGCPKSQRVRTLCVLRRRHSRASSDGSPSRSAREAEKVAPTRARRPALGRRRAALLLRIASLPAEGRLSSSGPRESLGDSRVGGSGARVLPPAQGRCADARPHDARDRAPGAKYGGAADSRLTRMRHPNRMRFRRTWGDVPLPAPPA